MWEMLRYDLLSALFGFQAVRARTRRPVRASQTGGSDFPSAVPKVVAAATSFYWKPVLCVQRSIVTARMLRRRGVDAEVVIGCRIAPFVGHAWVEVGGRIVNDSAGYQQKLCVLDRF
jgi:hypothetical protein